MKTGNPAWNKLQVPTGDQYAWDANSTYIQSPPFFETMERELPEIKDCDENRLERFLKFDMWFLYRPRRSYD